MREINDGVAERAHYSVLALLRHRRVNMIPRIALHDIVQRSLRTAQNDGLFTRADALAHEDIVLETPSQLEHGDYAFPVMRFAQYSEKNPIEIARDLCRIIQKDSVFSSYCSRCSVVAPGYINFYLAPSMLVRQAHDMVREGSVRFINVGKGEKMNLEFLSVNPTGELHVGHARTAFYGDVLGRVLAASGYDVTCEYYINNARHSAQIQELGKTVQGEGESYKGEYLDTKIALHRDEIEQCTSYADAGYMMANIIQKDIAAFLEHKTGIVFDVWKEEEDLYSNDVHAIQEVLRVLRSAGLVYEDEGAQWIATKQLGMEQDFVLVRSNGENTYFLADIAYHLDKQKRGFATLIDVWGADHQGHIQRMEVALRAVAERELPDTNAVLRVLIAQLVRLKNGEKLSKRRGTIITMSDMIDAVGVDVARYFYLTKSLRSQMEFDLDIATQTTDRNPVYYIQYTNARICSILKKAKEYGVDSDLSALHNLHTEQETQLLRSIIRVVDVVEEVAKEYHVHLLSSFVLQIARQFNQFYRDYRVIEGREVNAERLALVAITGVVIQSVLDLMGISHPDSM